jgi:Uma2 family endonuclease
MAVELVRKLWTIEEYEMMIEKGVLTKDNRVELIKGEIVEMAPIGMRHAYCVAALSRIFSRLPENVAVVWVQSPIQLPNDSEPEPDVALLRGPLQSYAHRRATAQDAILVVEVADTTLASDRGVKVPLYAEAGISEMWVVNMDEKTIEVYSEPAVGRYQNLRVAHKGDRLELPEGLRGQISVDEVLG